MLPNFKVKHDNLKNSFFLSTVIEYDKLEWIKLNLNIRDSESLTSFKSNVIPPSENSIFLCNNPKECSY